ncbi:hypothetical protein [Vibrio genomosp. F10]|uniref:hypothetical protein n=1 Tax=Vibrio genomosp. F10 TaxID=723171 RepID=UPI0002D409B0|nr:hypothetical protein [Vibrio genomosp. F10]OEF07316.1 hypothetical protein A1QI_17790 [Vibrio genomosp. F10 str. 9ZB36]
MQKSVIIKIAVAVLLPMISLVIGHNLHNKIETHSNKYNGVWQGQSVIKLNDSLLNSFATMVVDNGDIRLSVNNKLGDNNYTYDASLNLHNFDVQYARIEVTDREVNGLVAFQENTGVQIPVSGRLMELYGWRLEEDRLFFNIKLQGGEYLSYILKKSR